MFGIDKTPDGTPFTFFQCDCSEEAVIARMLACEPQAHPDDERAQHERMMEEMGTAPDCPPCLDVDLLEPEALESLTLQDLNHHRSLSEDDFYL